MEDEAGMPHTGLWSRSTGISTGFWTLLSLTPCLFLLLLLILPDMAFATFHLYPLKGESDLRDSRSSGLVFLDANQPHVRPRASDDGVIPSLSYPTPAFSGRLVRKRERCAVATLTNGILWLEMNRPGKVGAPIQLYHGSQASTE